MEIFQRIPVSRIEYRYFQESSDRKSQLQKAGKTLGGEKKQGKNT